VNRRFHICLLAVCLTAVGLVSAPARADVTYTFTGTNDGRGGDGQTVGFQFTTSNFITSLTSLLPSQLTSCTHCQAGSNPIVFLAPDIPTAGDGLQVNDSSNNAGYYLFSTGAFGTAGTYYSTTSSAFGGIVSDGKMVVSVPEPGSVAMTLGGAIMLALVCCFVRKPVNAGQLA